MNSTKLLLLSVNFIFGIILLLSYYYQIQNNKKKLPLLWGKIKKKWLVSLSIIIAAIGYIYLIYYLLSQVKYTPRNKQIVNNISILFAIILIISMFWLPLSLYYLNNRNNNRLTMLAILLVLFIVGFSAYKNVYLVKKLQDDNKHILSKNLAVLGASYFFIHTFFVDFIGWSYHFFV